MANTLKKRSKFDKVDPSLYLLLIPGIVLLIIFSYLPLYGVTLAFRRFNSPTISVWSAEWIGFENFNTLFSAAKFPRVIRNTLVISLSKMVVNFLFPIFVSILMNELTSVKFKRSIQTMIYLPHFLSWVILGGIIRTILAKDGLLNDFIHMFGGNRVSFLGNVNTFVPTIVVTEAWKGFGFGTIIYMAALTGIDPNLYEAASIDGAKRFRQIWHITIPGITPIMVLTGTLSLGGILNGGFDQIFNLINSSVVNVGEILDTFAYTLSFGEGTTKYDLSTAVSLFKTLVSLVLVSGTYYTAYKTVGYRIF